MKDKGVGKGENYAINVPLHDGMDDESYRSVFRPVIAKVSLALSELLHGIANELYFVE